MNNMTNNNDIKRLVTVMQKKANEAVLLMKRHKRVSIAIMAAIVVIVVLFFALQPQRSVASFCSAAKSEKPNLKGDKSYDILLSTFKRFDAVAPSDIQPDTKAVVKGYEVIVADPSKTIGTEFGIMGSQMRISDYIQKNCKDF